MKGKVIYVDFSSQMRKTTYSRTPVKKGLLEILINSIKRLFNFPDMPKRSKGEIYNFKRMV